MFVLQSLPIISLLYASEVIAAITEYRGLAPGVQEQRLMQVADCKNQVPRTEHRYQLLSVRSKLECAVKCELEERCLSLVYDPRTQTCHLANTKASTDCSNMESVGQAYRQPDVFYQEVTPCGSGQELDSAGQCVCAPGFAGSPCTRYFHDCYDMYNYGNWTYNGMYTVQPLSAAQPFKVLCRHITQTRTYVMQRKKKKKRQSFDKPWADYRQGFGDMDNDFWIGLEKLYLLTAADRVYKLRVNIKLINNSVIGYSYEDFKVTNETSGYRLSFNNSLLNGTDDCLSALHEAPFSTYDRDRDDSEDVNCAKTRKGGFWFRGDGCSTCNPHGVVYGRSDGLLKGVTDEAFWASLGDVAPFKISMYLVGDYDMFE